MAVSGVGGGRRRRGCRLARPPTSLFSQAVVIVDVLRRAGAAVTLASVESKKEVTCSRGVVLVADALLSDAAAFAPYDAIALPGGMPGAARLGECAALMELVSAQHAAGRVVAAILRRARGRAAAGRPRRAPRHRAPRVCRQAAGHVCGGGAGRGGRPRHHVARPRHRP